MMALPAQKKAEGEESDAQDVLARLRMARSEHTKRVEMPATASEQARMQATFRVMAGAYAEMAAPLAQRDPEAGKALAGSQLALFFDPKIKRSAEG